MAPSAQTEEARNNISSLEEYGALDVTTFEQILEMDDEDEDREFSRSIVYSFFDQAEATFFQMESAISSQDLSELSQLGHFLKGSSATLGLTKVKDACEKIQNYGQQKDESGNHNEPDKNRSLANIKKALVEVKKDYHEVVKILKQFYGDDTAE
ncbi:Phosphorelay intermediate protein [Microsporum canis]